MEHENGTGSAKSEISFRLDRHSLGSEILCKVNSSALKVRICVFIAEQIVVVQPDSRQPCMKC